jgi:hypothetical protein
MVYGCEERAQEKRTHNHTEKKYVTKNVFEEMDGADARYHGEHKSHYVHDCQTAVCLGYKSARALIK